MKTILFVCFFLVFSLQFSVAQTDLVLNESCDHPQRTYEYVGESNEKPSYEVDLNPCSQYTTQASCAANGSVPDNIRYGIKWDGSQWVWYKVLYICSYSSVQEECLLAFDIEIPAYQYTILATNPTDSPLPPRYGWEVTEGNCMPTIIYGYSEPQSLILNASCSQPELTYEYVGPWNGKPSYIVDLGACGDATTSAQCVGLSGDIKQYLVRWNGSAWEWVSNIMYCAYDMALENCFEQTVQFDPYNVLATNPINSLLPPQGGWIVSDGNCMPLIIAGYTCNLFQGSGIEADPYLISNLNDLWALSENPCLWDKHFKQTADIYASSTSTWNLGDHDNDGGTPNVAMGINSIGNISNPFSGTYNGQGYKIDGLTINRPKEDYIGLFGNNSGALQKIHLVAANVTGQYRVGAVVGYNDGSIDECISFGSVTGIANVGGLSGENDGGIANCYSGASVDGTERIGGFIGYNGHSGGEITNCYSFGSVTGDYELGGFCSDNDGDIFYCFYGQTTSGQNDTGKGEPTSDEDLQKQSTFSDAPANWDFSTIWKMGVCSNNGYPIFKWQGAVCSTQLIEEDCGRDLNYLDEQISFENIPNVNTYQIRVQGTDGNPLDEVIERTHATLRTFRLHVVPGIEFGETYNISVRGFVNGSWDEYGTVCQVSTPQSSAVIFGECGKVVTKRDELVNFRAVPGARTYKIRLQGPNGYDVVRTRSDKRFKLDLFPNIMNGATYIVTIAWSTTLNANPTNNELWSSYGEACELKTLFPIKLNNASCGATYYSRDDVMRFDFINGVSIYQVYITADGGYERTVNVTAPSNGVRFINVNSMLLGRTYNVQVRSQLNGTWSDWGDVCQVHLVQATLTQNNNVSELMAEEFLRVYPNPNNGTFTIQASNNSFVNVVNAVGQTIHTFNASEEVSKVELNLAPGIYYVSTTINGERLMERVVVQ
jgi:hypothetical protein